MFGRRRPAYNSNNETNANKSYIGEEYKGLRATPSIFGSPNFLGNAPPAQLHEPLYSAPITPEDIPAILEVLTPCPSGPLALRVFQQHPSAGLCWQDSLFIMLYNQDWFRPFLLETIQRYMEHFFIAGHTDLTYGVSKSIMDKNWGQWAPGVNIQTLPMVERQQINLAGKIKPIAAILKSIYDFGLPLAFWEYYCLSLHRYILLGYLFVKYPETRNVPTPLPKLTALSSRRKSISGHNYSKLHINFKEVVFHQFDTGMYCYNFTKGIKWFRELVNRVSTSSVSLIKYETPDIVPGNILGYYNIAHSSISPMKHVVSFFKCGGKWFLYDIDVGTFEFTDADTAVIEASKLDSFVFDNHIVEGEPEITTYRLNFENGTSVQVTTPTNVGYYYKYDKFIKNGSFLLVKTAAAGGHRNQRRSKTHHRRRNHARNRKTR